MKKQQFIDLAKKYAEGTSSEEETNAVEIFFEELQKSDKTLSNEILNSKRNKILRKINFSSEKTVKYNPKTKYSIYKIAAVLITLLGLTYAYSLYTKKTPTIQYATLSGEKKEIQLNDGSIVMLNANSSISVPEKFGANREIVLKGEAYFKVKRNPKHPFIVSTKDITIKVLGTSFDINAYPKHKSRVSVLTGKVEVTSPGGKKVILIKDEQVDYKENSGFVLSHHDSNDGIAWTNNVIILNNNTLEETALILENKYNIKIDFQEKAIEQYTISGKFKEPKLENVLESIALLKNLKIEYTTKNHVLIRRN